VSRLISISMSIIDNDISMDLEIPGKQASHFSRRQANPVADTRVVKGVQIISNR
jgi:hypothetical protein